MTDSFFCLFFSFPAGWFGSERNVEEVLAAHGAGEEVRKQCGVVSADGTIQVDPADMQRLREAAEAVERERQQKSGLRKVPPFLVLFLSWRFSFLTALGSLSLR